MLCVGDANKDSIVDIWNGEKMNAVRMMILENHSLIPECLGCGATEIMTEEDMIDESVQKLKGYYSSKGNHY